MKHRKAVWESCVLMLCLWAGWQALVGPNGDQPWPSAAPCPNAATPTRPGAARPYGGQASLRSGKVDAGAALAGTPAVSYARLPLSFEANQGQTDRRVKFLSRGRGYGLFLTCDEAVLEVQESGIRSQESGDRIKRAAAIGPFEPKKDAGRPTTNSGLETTNKGPGTTSSGPRTADYGQRTTDNELQTGEVLRLKLVNANQNAAVSGAHELPGKINYFIGNDPLKWRTNVPTYSRVRYRNVYPGIDLVYYGNQAGQLESDFVVAPGADPGAITLEVGARGQKRNSQIENRKSAAHALLQIAHDGDLVISTQGGELRLRKPLIYQEPDSGFRIQHSEAKDQTRNLSLVNRQSAIDHRQFREGHFTLEARNRVHVALGPYDHTRPLVIDPVLVYSTYLGGSGLDQGFGIAVDSSGNAYVTGVTNSMNFPTANPLQATYANAFVAKLNSTGSALVYSTYLGGSGGDQGFGIAVDSSGNAYVTGFTTSTDFPTTPGAFQTSLGGNGVSNAFVAKLNSTGSALVYSTYLGGSSNDSAQSIAVDSSGSAYVTGHTQSTDFPTANPLQASLGVAGATNAFVSKLNPAGSALVYSTYLGGRNLDYGYGITVDSSGNAYVTGSTGSSDFPTANPLQPSLAGSSNAFVAKLNSTGTALAFSTYLGGSGSDQANAIAVDSAGNTYVAGYTDSPDFPTVNAIQASLAEGALSNVFVAELNPTGSALVYSTYLGGSGFDQGNGIAVDSSANAYATGYTNSPNFPNTNSIQASLGGTGATNAFVSKVSPMGSALAYSTYLGGNNDDRGQGVAVDSYGNAYVTGYVSSTEFPVINPLQVSQGGGGDAFVAKIGTANSPGIAFGPAELTFPAQIVGTPSSLQSVTLTAAGSQPLILTDAATSGDFAFATTSTSCPYTGGTIAPGTTCTLDVTFMPTATGTRTGSLTINDNASGSPQSLSLTGTGVATAPVAGLSTTSLTFPGQLLGTTSAPQPVTLSNTGNIALTVTSIITSGDFSQTNNCGGSVAAGGSCTINVTFTPRLLTPLQGGSMTLTGTLTITDNSRDMTGSTQTVSLSGTYEDFLLAAATGSSLSATVPPGQAATYTLIVDGEGGFDQSVALTCGGYPLYSTCVVSPNSVVPGSNFNVIVTTTAPSAIAPRTFPQLPGPRALLMLAGLLAGIAWTMRRWRQAGASWRRTVLVPLAAGLLIALALAGCGGGGNGNIYPGTPTGTYAVTVTGIAGPAGSTALTHSVTLTLKVS